MRWRLHTSDCTWCGEKLLQPLRSTYISFNCKATVWKGHLSVTLAKVSATPFIHLCTAVIEHLHHIYIIFPPVEKMKFSARVAAIGTGTVNVLREACIHQNGWMFRENTFWFYSEKFMTEIPFGPAPKQLKYFDRVDCWMLPYAADKYRCSW